MSKLEWRKQDGQVNGYFGILRPYAIKRRFFGLMEGFKVFCYLRSIGLPSTQVVDSIEQGMEWAEKHHTQWHQIVDDFRERGELIKAASQFLSEHRGAGDEQENQIN